MAIPTLGREGGVVSKRRASSIHPSSTSQSKKKRRDENTRHGRHYALGPQRQPFSLPLWKPWPAGQMFCLLEARGKSFLFLRNFTWLHCERHALFDSIPLEWLSRTSEKVKARNPTHLAGSQSRQRQHPGLVRELPTHLEKSTATQQTAPSKNIIYNFLLRHKHTEQTQRKLSECRWHITKTGNGLESVTDGTGSRQRLLAAGKRLA